MNADMLVGGMVGGFIVFFVITFLICAIWFMTVINGMKNNRLFRINVISAGQPIVEWHRGQLVKHPKLGDCYFIKKLRREGRQYIPFYGSDTEYPTNKARIKYVPLTFYKNVYSPESYTWKEEAELEVIEKRGKIYEKVIKKVIRPIVTPLKSSMRQFNLSADKDITGEYAIKIGWFERNKDAIVSVIMIFGAMAVAAFIIIFAYQAASDGVFSVMPDWAKSILDAVTSGQAPPPTDIAP